MIPYTDIEDGYPDAPGRYAVYIENTDRAGREGVASWDGNSFSCTHLKDNEYITSWKPLS